MDIKKKACLFCGEQLEGNRASEHVFPAWLQEKYNLSNDGLLQTHFSENGEVLSGRFHNLGKHVYGRVCSKCNNGWMSQLEDKSKSLVVHLSERSLHFSDLNSAQCLILARWACKTAFCLHAASNYRPLVSEKHFKFVRESQATLPAGIWVFGHQHNSTQSWCWWQSPSWFLEGDDEHLSKSNQDILKQEAYKICFSINDLVLIVVHNPFHDMRLVLWKGVHYPIYPERGPVFWYERNDFPKSDTDKVCVAFLGGVGLKQIEPPIEQRHAL
jgi:hypothetical protein